MAPRQLILPPMEDDLHLHPEPGSKRVRPSSDEKSSMQVQLRACASACGTPWPGPAHWLALLALPWANGQSLSLPLLVLGLGSWQGKSVQCAAKTLLSVAATPFTTTASAVYYNPPRRTKWTSEQFIHSSLLKQNSPETSLRARPTCALKDRRALAFPRRAPQHTTPNGTHRKPNLHHEPLADTIAQPTTPQEETSGDEPLVAQGKRPIGFDPSPLPISPQPTNGFAISLTKGGLLSTMK
eukprot:scaffold24183_cov146-Isochrysis_galbana.AAC.1